MEDNDFLSLKQIATIYSNQLLYDSRNFILSI